MTDPSKQDYLEPERLRELLAQRKEVVIIDVRSPEEYSAGHVDGAINIASEQLAENSQDIAKDAQVVTVCNLGGRRCCEAADQLKTLGYVNVAPLRGGTVGWQKSK